MLLGSNNKIFTYFYRFWIEKYVIRLVVRFSKKKTTPKDVFGGNFIAFGGAGGTWTHTIYGRQILSLLRLPFRHNPVCEVIILKRRDLVNLAWRAVNKGRLFVIILEN